MARTRRRNEKQELPKLRSGRVLQAITRAPPSKRNEKKGRKLNSKPTKHNLASIEKPKEAEHKIVVSKVSARKGNGKKGRKLNGSKSTEHNLASVKKPDEAENIIVLSKVPEKISLEIANETVRGCQKKDETLQKEDQILQEEVQTLQEEVQTLQKEVQTLQKEDPALQNGKGPDQANLTDPDPAKKSKKIPAVTVIKPRSFFSSFSITPLKLKTMQSYTRDYPFFIKRSSILPKTADATSLDLELTTSKFKETEAKVIDARLKQNGCRSQDETHSAKHQNCPTCTCSKISTNLLMRIDAETNTEDIHDEAGSKRDNDKETLAELEHNYAVVEPLLEAGDGNGLEDEIPMNEISSDQANLSTSSNSGYATAVECQDVKEAEENEDGDYEGEIVPQDHSQDNVDVQKSINESTVCLTSNASDVDADILEIVENMVQDVSNSDEDQLAVTESENCSMETDSDSHGATVTIDESFESVGFQKSEDENTNAFASNASDVNTEVVEVVDSVVHQVSSNMDDDQQRLMEPVTYSMETDSFGTISTNNESLSNLTLIFSPNDLEFVDGNECILYHTNPVIYDGGSIESGGLIITSEFRIDKSKPIPESE